MADSKSYEGNSGAYVEEGGEAKHTGFFSNFQSRYAKVDPASYLRRPDESGFQYWGRRLGSLKPVELLLAEYTNTELRQYLNVWQLTFIGIGAIIGTGKAENALVMTAFPYTLLNRYLCAFRSSCCPERWSCCYDLLHRGWCCIWYESSSFRPLSTFPDTSYQ